METCDMALADALYTDGQRRLSWRERLFGWRISIEGWLMALLRIVPLVILLAVVWPVQPVAAEGPHHVCPSWCQKVVKGAGGWRYFNLGNGKVYAWGTPARGMKGHVVIMQSERFITQFSPADGFAYVRSRVYEEARTLGYNHAQATYLARGASSLKGALAMRVVQGVTRVGGAVTGRAGINLVFIPCQAIEEVLVGVRCSKGVQQ